MYRARGDSQELEEVASRKGVDCILKGPPRKDCTEEGKVLGKGEEVSASQLS